MLELPADRDLYILFAIFIGFVVSFDVTGLILSQHRDFATRDHTGGTKKNPLRSALIHAAWHAGLFSLYIAAISGVTLYFPELIKVIVDTLLSWLKDFLSLFNIEMFLFVIPLAQFKESVIWIAGIIALVFVWFTYLEKIGENHRKKPGNPNEVRWDVRGVLEILSPFIKRDHIITNTLAAAVAIDMLAISAVIQYSLQKQIWFDNKFVSKG